MAARIQEALGVETELIESGGGVFDVVADGQTVFSKHDEGRFPEEEEVLGLLQA